MSNDRDQLVELIEKVARCFEKDAQEIADAVIHAGWRPPSPADLAGETRAGPSNARLP